MLEERFLKYVSFDTQSDESSLTSPSTEKQWKLSNALKEECIELGFDSVVQSSSGIVYATLEGNVETESIGFLAHIDTATELSGKNVRPRIVRNYDGQPILLNDDYILEVDGCIGEDLVVTDGTTLLGGDDKAGIAIIMEAMEHIIQSKKEHGNIVVAFTVDEEVGRGVETFELNQFPVAYAFTVDGDRIDSVEYETFNAAQATIIVRGNSIHPGDAKDKMVNASLIALEIANQFPLLETPSHTQGREGFFHLLHMEGECEQAKLVYLIRDHDEYHFSKRKQFVQNLVKKYENVSLDMYDEYHNMAQFIHDTKSIERAKRAIKKLGMKPVSVPVRGGTDGALLTEKGLVCPNLGTGSYNHHGRFEYASLTQMDKMVQIVENIVYDMC